MAVAKSMDKFIMFGDSITRQSMDSATRFAAGAAIAFEYSRRLDVQVRGFSGFNTDQALVSVPFVIPPPEQARVRVLTIFFGANDARLPHTPGGTQQNVPVEKFKANLRAILTHPRLRAHEGLRVVLITPPPVDERMLMESDEANRPQPTRTAANAARYAQAVREVGAALDVVVLDLWLAMMQRAGHDGGDDSRPLPGSREAPLNEELRAFLNDGLHFSGAGYQVLYTEVMRLIGRTWPDLQPNNLPLFLPSWEDIDTWKDWGVELKPSL